MGLKFNPFIGNFDFTGTGAVAWGDITGTLSNQSDLQTALNAKEPTISSGTTGQYWRGDKSWQTLDKTAVGLSNVDNTSDANKPISTATQTALDNKQAGPLTGDVTTSGAAATVKTNLKTHPITLTIDGAGSVITTGAKAYWRCPYDCTVSNWTVVADVSGSIVIDVKKSTYSSFPTTSSIAGTEKPTLSSAQKNEDTNLTTWTTTITAGDCLEFVVDSVSTVKKVSLILGVVKT